MKFEWIKKNGANWAMVIANTKRRGEVVARVHFNGYQTWSYFIRIPGKTTHRLWVGEEFPFKMVQEEIRELIVEQFYECALRTAELEEMLVD